MNLNKMLAFLSQEDLQELTEKILSTEDKTFQNITFRQVLPFLDESYIDALFTKHLLEQEIFNSLLPFVSDSILETVVQSYLNKEIDCDIKSMLPFLNSNCVAKIAYQWIDENKSIHKILPFLSDQTLHEIVLDYTNGNEKYDIDELLPFLSQQDIRLVFQYNLKKDK